MSFSSRWLAAVVVFVGTGIASGQAGSGRAQQAIALEQQGRYAEAEQAWEAVIARNPRDAVAYANLGLDRAREGKYPEAVEAYRTALKLDPKIHGLQLDLGLALFKQGQVKEAIEPLKIAAGAAPGDPQPRILLGMSYYGMGQFAEAIPFLRFAVEKMPDNEELLGTLAQSCLHAKQYECTLEEYKRILTVNPNSAQAHMLAGEALDGMKRPDEAIAEFREAEKVAPVEPNVHFGLGYLLWTQHRYPEAKKEFELELKNDPRHAQALAYLGDTEIKLEQPAEAEADLRKAVELPDAIRMAWVDLGIVLAGEGKNDEAAEDFERAIAMDPKAVDAHWRLARLYQAEGKKDQAQAEFAKAAALHEKQDESLVKQISGAGAGQPKP